MPQQDHLENFHNHLVLHAGVHQTGTRAAVGAESGVEEGCLMIGQSCIVGPEGAIVAMCGTLGDEVVVAPADLDRCYEIDDRIVDLALYRRPECCGPICARS